MPSSVRPHGAPGSRPGPHSRYQPDSSSTNGSSQRPVPKYGTARLRHQSVRAPCPGSISAISVTAPSTSSTIPTSERPTAGDMPSDSPGAVSPDPRLAREACDRRVEAVREVLVRRRVATR